MSEKRKTAPDVASIESGVGNTASGQALNLPKPQYTTEANEPQGIVQFLPCGAENAISSEALIVACGISNIRQLRKIVAAERDEGALILSNTSGGYFLPSEGEKGREEMQHFVNTVRSKALNLLKAARPARNALRVLEGQERFEEEH